MQDSKSIVIPVNAAIHAVLIQNCDQQIKMLAQNSRGITQKNSGFLLPNNSNVIRTLGNALLEMAAYLETTSIKSKQAQMEENEIVLSESGYSIHNSPEYKGQFYFYHEEDDYDSPDFASRDLAITAAMLDLNTPANQRAGIRI